MRGVIAASIKAGIDIVRPLVGLDRHGRRAALADGEPGRDIGVRRHDHLVARGHAERAQGEMQGVESVGDADGVCASQ